MKTKEIVKNNSAESILRRANIMLANMVRDEIDHHAHGLLEATRDDIINIEFDIKLPSEVSGSISGTVNKTTFEHSFDVMLTIACSNPSEIANQIDKLRMEIAGQTTTLEAEASAANPIIFIFATLEGANNFDKMIAEALDKIKGTNLASAVDAIVSGHARAIAEEIFDTYERAVTDLSSFIESNNIVQACLGG